ncbi:hypothetical protein DYB32_007215 [Aphanomyces invadans]|uniref:HSF-type DNA-binding domain-containing protein n=1 Tax=Aphanomyces invadans TaxID=157072 RepID=A0A418AR35_9STRA|nr:hypothetical protein DYB32_007215 [Aphanomyces invadans]
MPSGSAADIAPFLKVLRAILETESTDILRWTPDGAAFEILDMDRLVQTVLPKYFKHNKYPSFQRQLNYFHFKKWTKSRANVCTFSNEFFLRDAPDKSAHITRKKSVSRKESMDEWGDNDGLDMFDPLVDGNEEALEAYLRQEDLDLLATLEEMKC